MDQLRHRFHDRSQVLLQDLFLEATDLQEVITLFLATLELNQDSRGHSGTRIGLLEKFT